jgi:hypothetical protein
MKRVETLAARAGPWYSQNDKDVFFGWLKKVKSVVQVRGRLHTVYMDFQVVKFNEKDLHEILALFRRYNVDLGQLAKLERRGNKQWFADKSQWWYVPVFRRKPKTVDELEHLAALLGPEAKARVRRARQSAKRMTARVSSGD